MNRVVCALVFVAAVCCCDFRLSGATGNLHGAPQWDQVDSLMVNQSLPKVTLDAALDSLQSNFPVPDDLRGENGRKHILNLIAGKLFYGVQAGDWKRKFRNTNYALLGTEGYLIVVAWDGVERNF